MSKKVIIGNWKMNPSTSKEGDAWFKKIAKLVVKIKKTEVVICPPFLYLEKLSKIRTSKLKLGAQDSFWGDVGPFTGEISSDMLYNSGVRFVILGHSERRALGETNELINKKIKSSLTSGLVPVVCIGEKERDVEHNYFDIVKSQLVDCLKGISRDSISRIIFAYEPVWSISTTENRRDATSSDTREMVMFMRKVLSDISSPQVAHNVRIIYGGSVSGRDAEDFLKNGQVDGLLVGKASLEPKRFFEIIEICEAKV